jgi:four helix bundle protein
LTYPTIFFIFGSFSAQRIVHHGDGLGVEKLGTRNPNANANTKCSSTVSRKGDDIAERLLDVAAAVLRLLPALRKHPAARRVVEQLERCAPAGGANYEEARGAESRADFVHKVRVALKEVRETRYWLRLAQRAALLDSPATLATLVDETNQLVAILTASAKTARTRSEEAW